MPLATVMAVEITKLRNDDGLSSLLEGKDAHTTQAFFVDYLCGDIPGISHLTVIMVIMQIPEFLTCTTF